MGTFLVPFDTRNVFEGLHESLYADHTSLSSFMAVTTAALWSHLCHYPDNLSALTDVWGSLDASCLHLLIPFLVPLALWFGLDRFVKQSENAFKAISHIVSLQKDKASSSHDDAELEESLELMKKNRRDYQELLRLCRQFPGQREKADLERLKKARKRTSGSGDIMRLQCVPSDFSDSTDTDWAGRDVEQDSDRTFPGYTEEDDDDAGERESQDEVGAPTARPRTKKYN